MAASRVELPNELHTPRLLLRPPVAGDEATLHEAILESFAELTTWMIWAKEQPTEEQTATFVRDNARKREEGEETALLMLERETGALIGVTGATVRHPGVPCFEIGYWCRTSAVGKGYVSEATYGVAAALFEDFGANRVEIKMDDRNERSWRVAERLGFSLEAVLKRVSIANDGSFRDSKIYAALALEELRSPGPAAER